jgi:hypothetical protein
MPELNDTGRMMQLYMRVMGINSWNHGDRFTVRVFDGMDGCWCDVVANVDLETALRRWCTETANGTTKIRFAEIDYYCIFPANVQMLWSGDFTMRGEEDER